MGLDRSSPHDDGDETTGDLASTESVEVKVDVDLTQILGSPERYYEFATEPAAAQAGDIKRILPKLLDSLRLYMGDQQLTLEFKDLVAARADEKLFLDGSIGNLSTFRFLARLPGSSNPLKLVVPYGAPIDYPIVITVQIPAAHVSTTRWLEAGVHESEPFVWADRRYAVDVASVQREHLTAQDAELRSGFPALAAPGNGLPEPRFPSHRARGYGSHSVRARLVFPRHYMA